jgi:hypothetical protein
VGLAKDALCWARDSDLQITSTCFIFTLAGQPFCNMQRLWETIPARGVITSLVSNGVKVNFEPILQGYPVMLTHGDVISIQSATASHTWQFSANEAEFIVCASYTPFVGEAVHLLSREDKLEQLLAIFDDPAPSCDARLGLFAARHDEGFVPGAALDWGCCETGAARSRRD